VNLTAPLGQARTIEVAAGPLRIYERGQGEPILFLHGLFANAVAWRKVVPLLAESFHCVTADWPFGSHSLPMNPEADLSPGGIAATVADAIEALDLDGVTLVGNDGGGMLCQLVATTRPQRLARLVLTPCDAYDNFPPPAFAPLCDLARSEEGMELIADAMADRESRRRPEAYGWLSHEPLPDQVLDHFARPLRDPAIRRDAAKFLTAVAERYTLDAAAQFRSFERPVLVAWATDDRFFPAAHGERLAHDFPQGRHVTIPAARTYVAEDQPERIAELIAAFIADTGSR
jgi:pimeloyl-ACP methyl ester carboxylesterase